MMNIGQMPRLRIIHDTPSHGINITGGPLRPYKYRLQRVDFHYSNDDRAGSEHAINSKNFPMEVSFHPQLFPRWRCLPIKNYNRDEKNSLMGTTWPFGEVKCDV